MGCIKKRLIAQKCRNEGNIYGWNELKPLCVRIKTLVSTRFSQILRSIYEGSKFWAYQPQLMFYPQSSLGENRWNLAGAQATGGPVHRSLPTTNQGPVLEPSRPPFSASRNPESSRKLQQPAIRAIFFHDISKLGPPKLCNFAVLLVKNGYRYLVSLFELVLFPIVLEKEFTVASLVNCLVASIVPELKLWSTVTLLADISYILSNSHWFKSHVLQVNMKVFTGQAPISPHSK